MRDILEKTSKSLESVTIEPNGRWSTKGDEGDQLGAANDASFDDDDDDDLEISEVNVVGGRRLETPLNTPGTSTPASGARNSGAGPRGAGSTSNKRPAPAVIDLTLSSDEDDDEPIQRPAKRQSNAANGYRGPGSTGFLSESPVGYL